MRGLPLVASVGEIRNNGLMRLLLAHRKYGICSASQCMPITFPSESLEYQNMLICSLAVATNVDTKIVCHTTHLQHHADCTASSAAYAPLQIKKPNDFENAMEK